MIELVERLGDVVWIGDAAQIRVRYVRRQKTGRRDAGHILRLLMENRFPKPWTPSAAHRDLRQLLVEAVQTANRLDEGFRRQYAARCHHQPKGVAKVAAARKLAVRLYSTPASRDRLPETPDWMLRQNVGYPEIARIESSPRLALVGTCGASGSPLRGSAGRRKPGRDSE